MHFACWDSRYPSTASVMHRIGYISYLSSVSHCTRTCVIAVLRSVRGRRSEGSKRWHEQPRNTRNNTPETAKTTYITRQLGEAGERFIGFICYLLNQVVELATPCGRACVTSLWKEPPKAKKKKETKQGTKEQETRRSLYLFLCMWDGKTIKIWTEVSIYTTKLNHGSPFFHQKCSQRISFFF